MQTPTLSAILLLFPYVCMEAQKAEVASALQSVFCASDPCSAFAQVLSVAFPCPSNIKDNKLLLFTFRQPYVRTDKTLLLGYYEVSLLLNLKLSLF